MQIINTAKKFIKWKKSKPETIGFVPTMGALHKGHLSLIELSKSMCKKTVVSIFLNPTQFSPNEDLNSYPKTLNKDILELQKLTVDVLFLPTENEMYNNVKNVQVPSSVLFQKLEGASRPHFFNGVTTIVSKLFNVIEPSHTFFGEKDIQQLIVINNMIKNMKYPIRLVSCPTIRNKNGLALSSRNQHLSSLEQKEAPVIYQGLMNIKTQILGGERNPKKLKQGFVKKLSNYPNLTVDYISIACFNTLNEIETIQDKKLIISAAVFFKTVRLIDNIVYQSSM